MAKTTKNGTNGSTNAEPIIKDAAVGKGVFTLVELKGESYIHYNLPQGYLLFAVKADDALAIKVNNHLADVLEAEHGKATRQTLKTWAAEQATL